jgi:hypothetical protein
MDIRKLIEKRNANHCNTCDGEANEKLHCCVCGKHVDLGWGKIGHKVYCSQHLREEREYSAACAAAPSERNAWWQD